MHPIKAFPLSVLAAALLCSTALFCGPVLPAQNSAVAPRITTDVNELSLAALKGNVPRLAQAQFDQGEAASSTQLTHMRLVLSRSTEQQAALDAYLAQLQDKSSPNYHKWLTPEQFGQLYGPADSDVAALVAWLESHGLQVETVSKGRTNIAFNGTVSQVEEAFHTSIHSYQAGNQQFTSNTTDPRIPSALAPVVKGVAHLNTIHPKPQFVRGSPGKINPQTGRLESANALSANGARPELTETGPDFLDIVPGDAATIYDTPNSFNANFAGGTSYTGATVNIGVGGDAETIASIVATYRSLFLGNSTQPILNYCSSSSSCSSTPGSGYYAADTPDGDEAFLDMELSGGLAPGASIYYYASSDLITGIEAAIDANLVDVFSLSFGECEQNLSTSDNAQINSWWEQAAGQGIAVTVSTGDSGSASCDGDTAKTTTVAKYGLSVSGYASTPYNIAVGGTDFWALENQNSFSSYVNTSFGNQGAPTYYRTALSYIPESIWNDSTLSDTQPLDENQPESGKYASIVAGSGGHSSCSTNNSVDESNGSVLMGSCISGYSKPSWQAGTGVYDADAVRDIPDVSLMSGNGYDLATWLVCDDETEKVSGTTVTLNCSNISDGYFDGFGGTSTAAPAFAGILALVQQSVLPKTGCTWVNCSRLGQAAQTLYALYNGISRNSVFHDVLLGNNSVPCVEGSPNCAATTTTPVYYFETGYNAGTGYDLASGMGSVDATQLVNDWSSAASLAAPVVTMATPTPNPVTTTQSLSVSVTVASSSGTPATGEVFLTGGGYTSSPQNLVNGSYTFTVPAGSLAVGVDTLTVTYGGSSTYAAATSNSANVTVTGSTSTATFALNNPLPVVSPTTIAPGSSSTASVTVSSSNGYAGTVTLSCALTNYPSGAVYLPSCSNGSNTVTLSSGTTGGTATITVYTTAATGDLLYPKLPGKGSGNGNEWTGAGGGAVLAFLLFLGIPARRRNWRSMLVVLVLMAALGSLAACGGGGGGSTGTPGTTAGVYTFTVTGTGNPIVTPAPTTTFTVTVN
jgi:hypothetical protein